MVESFSQYHQEDFDKILSSPLCHFLLHSTPNITVFLWLHFPELGKSCVLIRYCVTSDFYISRRGVEHRRISHNQSHLRFRFHAAFLKKENLHSLLMILLYCLLGIRFFLQLFASFSIVINVDKKLYLGRPASAWQGEEGLLQLLDFGCMKYRRVKKRSGQDGRRGRPSFSIAKQKLPTLVLPALAFREPKTSHFLV